MQVRKQYRESDLVIVAVNVWEQSRGEAREKAIRSYIEKNNLNFNVVLAKDTTAEAYGVKGIPTAFILAPDGTVAFSGHPGEQEFDETIQKLVKELQEVKLKAIKEAVESGTAEVTVAKGKGFYTSLSERPEGFTVGSGKSTKVDGKLLKAIVEAGERADAAADAESYYVYINAKGSVFQYTCKEGEAPDAVKELFKGLTGK